VWSHLLHLGQIANPRHAVASAALPPEVLGRHECAALQAPLDEVDVPDLVEGVAARAGAAQHDAAAAERLEGGAHVGERIAAQARGHDAGVLEGTERVEGAEQLGGAHEVVHHLDARPVTLAVAAARERVDARAVLVPLVRPQPRVRTPVRNPVPLHEGQELLLPVGPKYVADVVEARRYAAVGVVRAVAVVGPGNGPRG